MSCDSIKSLSARVVNREAGTLVHVLSISVERAVDAAVFEERAAQIAAEIRNWPGAERWDSIPAILFREYVPYAANTEEAAAFFRHEMQRPSTPATERQLRIAYFELADGSARLIARAHRALIGRQLLFRIAMHLACGEDIGAVEPDSVAESADAAKPDSALASADSAKSDSVAASADSARPNRAVASADSAKPDISSFEEFPPIAHWASSAEEPGTSMTEPVLIRSTRNHLILALTRVLSSFNQGQRSSLPVLIDRTAMNGRTLASGAGCQLLALSCDLNMCAERAQAEWQVSQPRAAVWLTDERLNELSELWGADAVFQVGLAIAEALPQANPAVREITYRAFQNPPFPLTILCDERVDGHLAINVQYDCAMVSRYSAESLQRCLVNVMTAMTSAPGVPLAGIALLTEAERHATLLLGSRKGNERLLADCRLEERVTALARANPRAVAVSDKDGMLTYDELERHANRLARYLTARGIGRGKRVGLCLCRSSRMLVASVAVLKAGGVYVPIDPNYPAERIAYICEDAQLSLVLFDQGEPFSIDGQDSIALAELLRDCAELPDEPLAERALSINDPAYMIYTSGSTGRPKGVLVSHRNVQALLGAVERQFTLGAEDVWSLFHSFAFDFSVWEAWGALLTGGRVHVVSYEVSRNPEEFIELINEQRITVLSQTPSAFGQLMAHERQKQIEPHLRLVIFGGEALDARSLLGWFDRHPETQCRLINMFGITETTVHVTATEIRRMHALTGSRTVGRPIEGWGVYVLGPDQSVLPPGVDGEIYVSGSGVALGYHNKPELDQQRFLPDLLGSGRMYRSGDRGRLLPSGELLHLGRIDNQIKLRGFRIELDEIRNVLLRCPGVESAAALFTQRDMSDAATARIDAYVVMSQGSLRDVWTRAMQLLPEYMLPSSIARVSSMPLTRNGKLNPKQLPDKILEKSALPGGNAEVASTTANNANTAAHPDIERHLVEIWTELFAKPIRPEDNFFDVGGNSLFAIRLSTRLRQRGLPGLHLRDLYVHQTIARLSPVIAQQGRNP
jgi:amino acid adenylation domain-containing protein